MNYLIGMCEVESHNYLAAHEAFNNAIRVDPKYAEVRSTGLHLVLISMSTLLSLSHSPISPSLPPCLHLPLLSPASLPISTSHH